ncbi:HEPN domain-containing protein [Patescibacteria group bacterium]|nr:HEPN domain-containing protein [Patescibacteria group bacterium]
MNPAKAKELINYWKKTAEHSYDTMLALYKSKRYSDCLFYGHLVLEKILKGHVVKTTKKQTPYIHDLVRLAAIAELDLGEEIIDFLDDVNKFNLRTRYPEYRLRLYKACTKEFTKKMLDKIIQTYKMLCQKLKQEK